MLESIHHVAFVVESGDAAAAFLEGTFGLKPESRTLFGSQGVDLAIYKVGSTYFEVVMPTRADTSFGQFLSSHGPGIHHVAFGVPDIASALADLSTRGAKVNDHHPKTGRSGWTLGNLDALSELGIELQLVQSEPSATS